MAAAYAGPDCELRPDPESMRAFCEWWFDTASRGVLEIGWVNPRTGGITKFAQFDREDIDGLVERAVRENMVVGQSMYIRAATVAVSFKSGHYTSDEDFEQAPGIWNDIDTLEDVERAKKIETIVRPNAIVITGTVPHQRLQSWVKSTEPIENQALVRELNIRLVRLYGGDSMVINPSSLMRMPGTIAWPYKDMEHRIPELTQFIRPGPDDKRPASYSIALLTSQLPREDTGNSGMNGTPHEPFDFGFAGLSTVAGLVTAIKSGNHVWHKSMIRLVAHWVGQGRSSVEILGHAADWTLPGYAVQQTRAEVAQAIKGARDKWGVPDHDATVGSEPENPFGAAIFDPWGELTAPTFPIHALPDVLHAYVESRARIMGADPCALAWSALSAASAALDGRTRLRMKRHDGWVVPPSLWVALIGRSSSKKTPIITDAWRPLDALQNVALRAYFDQVAQYNRLPKEEKKDTEPPPRPRRLISNDATMESLQDILANQDRGIAMLRDELSGFIGGLDKYSAGGKGGADRAFFLQAYNGGPHVVDRVGRGTVSVNNLLMTICGGIQPDKLASFKDLTDDGLWQRFIPIIVQQCELGTDESDGALVDAYTTCLQTMVDVSHGDIASMSNAAHDVRSHIERELFELERAEPLGGRFASFTGKLPGLFGRLCLVLSYMQPSGLGYVVSGKIAEQARTLIMKCVLPHAVNVYLTMGDTGVSMEAIQAIASYILTRKVERLVISDLTSSVRVCRNHTVPEVGRMLSPLVAGGWLLPETELPGNRAWLVNPALQSSFAERAEQEKKRKAVFRDLLVGRQDGEDC